MERSYAVAWRRGKELQQAGRLDLGPVAFRLEGGSGVADVRYADVLQLSVTRQADERIAGRPTLVLQLTGGRTLRIACVGEPGVLPEVAERLSRSRASAQPVRS